MKNIILTIMSVIVLVLTLQAQEDPENLPYISGYFQTDQRFLQKNGNPWIWNENRLNLELNKETGDNAMFYSDIWLRNMGLPAYYNFSSLYNKGITDPYSLEIREAYFQVKDFLINNLDFKAGRQIFHWGTADKINPTNNLNPYDFEDILDFGRYRGTEAVQFTYYFDVNNYLEVVAEPFFRPANLPAGAFADIMTTTVDLPQGMQMASYSDSLFLPDNKIKNSAIAGLRFNGFIANINFSLSYVYGRDYLPQPSQMDITPIDQAGNVNIDLNLYYPRQHIFGFDMATNLGGALIWAEAAAFMPTEDVKLTSNLHTVNPATLEPMTITTDSVLISSKKPYVKYVVGMDYNFANGIYLNIQYDHGFLHERGKENLNDYYFIHLDKSFFYDRLKITPVNGAVVISDYNAIKDNYTLVYMPEITYRPFYDFSISLSAVAIDGKGNSIFSSMKDMDMFIVKMKYNF